MVTLASQPRRTDPPGAGEVLDCVVIGAGPAGLTAAIYLARFRRRFLVIDGGAARARLIPRTHNHSGWPTGVSGKHLLRRMTAQASRYGAAILQDEVRGLARNPDGFFHVQLRESALTSRTVLLATGKVDVEPQLPCLCDAIARGLIRHCGICDGFEMIGHRLGVLGRGESGLGEALFLADYTDQLTLMSLGQPLGLNPDQLRQLAARGVTVVEEPIAAVRRDRRRINAFVTRSGGVLSFDSLYSALGDQVRSHLATGLGARSDEKGALFVGSHQETSVEGLYAAGDVVAGLDQISVAMGQAAVAATDVHNRLRGAK